MLSYSTVTPLCALGVNKKWANVLHNYIDLDSEKKKLTVSFACISLRGLFIIDGKGILRQITMNDLPVGRSVDETLRLVQAFQYTDKHGEGTRGWIRTNRCAILI